MHDRSKLPRWAQSELEVLAADVAYWKGKANAGPDDSDTFVMHADDDDQPLGRQPVVRFQVSGANRLRDSIQVYVDGDSIRVRGGDTIQVEPQASNVVRIRQERL